MLWPASLYSEPRPNFSDSETEIPEDSDLQPNFPDSPTSDLELRPNFSDT